MCWTKLQRCLIRKKQKSSKRNRTVSKKSRFSFISRKEDELSQNNSFAIVLNVSLFEIAIYVKLVKQVPAAALVYMFIPMQSNDGTCLLL